MPTKKASSGFTEEELAAMKEHAREVRARRNAKDVDGEQEVLQKIAAMPPADRALAERLHALIHATVPGLVARTWYGMPAYTKGGQVLCFFQPASKFKTRYATLGFSDEAALDEGQMWPVVFALNAWAPADEARITALLKRAVG